MALPIENGTEHASARSKAEERTAARNRKKKEHRKEVKRQQRTAAEVVPPDAQGALAPAADAERGGQQGEEKVEVEYVSRRDEAAEEPAFHEFAKVFERFATAEELLGTEAASKKGEDAAARPVGAGAEAAGDGPGEDEEERPSMRRLRKETRFSVAELKRHAERPEVVEQWDVTAADPQLLVFLKGYRNAVPVPRHWSQKRAYLQGKRGVEKKPFQLPGARGRALRARRRARPCSPARAALRPPSLTPSPLARARRRAASRADFIAATGIEKIRQVVAEREESKRLKATSRESTRPKSGRLDLDYQVLHDAFFKYQTKPQMSGHGDVYWEGKENEVHLREKRPGQLSADLRRALGMGDDPLTPPPWLLNMQRYGPPPSYPHLSLPGLNAPLPEGASYGTHPGGWGKPPVDELGTALYGNPFAQPTPLGEKAAGAGGLAGGKPWGELDSESEAESEEEEEAAHGATDDEIARGISSLASAETGGTATPVALQLRKERAGTDTPSSVAGADTPLGAQPAEPPRALYTVLEERAASVGSAAFGSAHTYAIPPARTGAAEPAPAGRARAKGPSGAVEVALDPSELEDLDEETLKQRYEAQVSAAKRGAQKEDMSDLVQEHEARKRRKVRAACDADRATASAGVRTTCAPRLRAALLTPRVPCPPSTPTGVAAAPGLAARAISLLIEGVSCGAC